MAHIQDIHALEQKIADAVQEYMDNKDAYFNTRVHIYLNDDMEYDAELLEDVNADEDRGIYPIDYFITNNATEIDYDNISKVANEWIFLI